MIHLGVDKKKRSFMRESENKKSFRFDSSKGVGFWIMLGLQKQSIANMLAVRVTWEFCSFVICEFLLTC